MKLYTEEQLKPYVKGPHKGQPNLHQKVKLRCDDCGVEFERVLSLANRDETHKCQSCGQIHRNKTRDPAIHIRMVEAARNVCTGKTLEERCGEVVAAKMKAAVQKASSGKNNPNYGGKYSRGFADNPLTGTFEEIYGVERATELRKRRSENSRGEKNPRYGKPSPIGQGNGWTGWYNGVLFASILELSFMIHCDKTGIKFEAISNKKKFKVQYEFLGSKRNYFPDFLINEDTIIEVKPKHLVDSQQNAAKIQAARNHFSKFEVRTEEDFQKLKTSDIIELYKSGSIKFIDRYETKFKERYNIC